MFDEEFTSETSLVMQFINVFSLVSIGEIGDRSQVSIMYASSLSSFKNIVLAIIFSNIILSILSCFLGNIIAYKFNVRSLTLASGFLFVFLGFCALIMTIIQDFGIVNSN